MSIDYAFQPRLRTDSPWDDQHSPGNLGFSAGRDLTCLAVTHSNILTSIHSTVGYPPASARMGRSPTTASYDAIRSFGTLLEPRYIIGAKALD